jgi:hypothetical protein
MYGGDYLDEDRPYPFPLISPKTNHEVIKGKLTFIWEKRENHTIPESEIDQYEISFWSHKRRFRKTYTVSKGDSGAEQVQFVLEECRKIFPRHGRYYWRVTAVNPQGRRTSSEIRSFTVRINRVGKGFSMQPFNYEVQYQYTHRLSTEEYKIFLSQVSPTASMGSFSDFSLIFRQQELWSSYVDFEERIFILSQFGMGVELSGRFRMLKNIYFAMHPRISVSSSWYSTGLSKYTSMLTSVSVGCDWSFLPSGHVTLQTNWIPMYRIRYAELEGDLRTFQGEGWEMGIRLIIPHKILKPFRFLGFEFDFERIPIEFSAAFIEDEYTGTLMKIRRLSIGYLL